MLQLVENVSTNCFLLTFSISHVYRTQMLQDKEVQFKFKFYSCYFVLNGLEKKC